MAKPCWRMQCFLVLAWGQFFGLTATATYLLLTPSPGDSFNWVWDKALHFICWFVLLGSLQIPWLFRPRLWWAALGLFLYSVLVESLQQLSPPRQFSLGDMLANGLGVLFAWMFLVVINPLLQKIVVQRLRIFLTGEQQ